MNKRQVEKRISLIPESVFNNSIINDAEFLFILKKTEKIITATYILTDFIPNEETLKKSLKDNSHESLNSVCDFIYNRVDRSNSVQRIKSSFIKLLTQYNLAFVSGYISQMNSQIIKDEINNLLRIIGDLERDLIDEVSPDLRQNYFSVDVRNKRHYVSNDSSKNNKSPLNKQKALKNNNVFYKNNSFVYDDKDNREIKVLEIIKDKNNVSIKDISEVILDCSEKTIQRTLNKLIEEGKVKKTGERRWARYELL